MKKIYLPFSIFLTFFVFSPSVLAAQDFDYYFGQLLIPRINVQSQNSNLSSPTNSVVNSNANSGNNSAQIASMQATLNKMNSDLAKLNSNLSKPTPSVLASKEKETVVVAKVPQIPLLLEEPNKDEKTTFSVFASLIPPDVRNSPLLATHLAILTLGLFGVILYLYFTRRQEKKHVI